MGYLLVLSGTLLALVISLNDPQPNNPRHSMATMNAYAQHLAQYRGWVRDYTQGQDSLPVGTIQNSALTVPNEMAFPSFDHHARYAADGNIYVWSDEGGALYAASSALSASASLCRVISTRQCVSGRDTRAVLSSSQTPNFIPTGSTVYVWQR